jgi:hypothetical protein
MHAVKGADMLVAKTDPLMKKIEDYEKMSPQEGVQAMDARMTCEVCGETRHLHDLQVYGPE